MTLPQERSRIRFAHACLVIALGVPSASPATATGSDVSQQSSPQHKTQNAARVEQSISALQQQGTTLAFDAPPPKTLEDYPSLGGSADLSNITPTMVEVPTADAVIEIPPADSRAAFAQTKRPQTILVNASSSLHALDATVTYLNTSSRDDVTANTLSPVGVAFQLNLDPSARNTIAATSSGSFKLGIDYSRVDMSIGGDFAERLSLYEGHDCTFASDGTVTACNIILPMHGYHDVARQQLVAEIDAATVERWFGNEKRAQPAQPTASSTAVPTDTLIASKPWPLHVFLPSLANQSTLGQQPPVSTPNPLPSDEGEVPPAHPSGSPIIILSAGTDSPTGDYGAVPVGDVLDYQVGLNAGTASINYPIPLPPPAAGSAPDVSLNYDSGAVDGTSLARSAQLGPVGLGWATKSGAIVRLMRTAPSGTGNLCYTVSGTDFVFSLNGMSSRLVQISGNDYALRDDPRWKVQRVTSTASGHPDYEKLFWVITSPDGTKYRFGGEFEPETNVDQNSVFWVPSFINATASSCNTGAGGLQNRAWQWNLDRVEDTNGNVISYFYEQEQNYYKAWNYLTSSYVHRPYVRAGQVKRIEYAKRNGASVQPNARVLFHSEMRCNDPTQVSTCDTTAKFPDTPSDLQCGPSGCAKISPTFWTYRRLHAVQTQVYDNVNTRWTTAGLYELNQSFPIPPVDPNGLTSTQKLWLDSIVRRPGGDFKWSPYNQIEAEDADGSNGISIAGTDDVGSGDNVDTLQAGDWLRFDRVNFSEDTNLFLARVWSSAAMNIEVRLDSPAAAPVATIPVPNQSSTWKTVSAALSGVTGIRDVYIYFSGANINKLKLNWIRFNRAAIPIVDIAPVQFGYVMLANRNNPYATLRYQIMPRVMTMTNELGGVTEFTYGQTHTTNGSVTCTTSSMDNTVARPPLDCFRGYYVSDFAGQGDITFAKYKVLQTRSWDAFSGNAVQTLSYSYSPPVFAYYDDPTSDRKYWNDFRGHEVVTTTDAAGVKVEHRFYRGLNGDRLNTSGGTFSANVTRSDGTTMTDFAWLRGKEFETRVIAPGGTVLDRSLTTYLSTLTAGSGITGAYFTAPQFITDTTYGTVNKTTQTDLAYDSYGNVTQRIERGDLGTTADDRNTVNSYVYNTTAYIVDGVSSQKLCTGATACAAGSELSRTDYEYDNAGIGNTPTKGNVTRVRAFAQTAGTPIFFDTMTAYDIYGRVSSMTDPKNNTTTTAYHPFYGYVQSVTNALNHVVSTVSDPKWGVPLTVTDPNGNVTTLQYDSYGRRVAVWLPTEPTSGPASAQYIYLATARPAYVQSRSLMTRATSSYVDAWTYVDGFGRPLQTQRADVTASRVVASKAYNALGQLLYDSAPYAASGAPGSGYVAPSWPSLAIYHAFTYDERGNLKKDETFSGSTALWSTQTLIDGWTKSVYDANGNRTDYASDAFGRLTQVTEYAPATQLTFYSYNGRDDLTQVTDAASNITTIAYDLLSRKTSMTDPDMGTWNYGYDANGNLTGQQDARGWWLYLEYDGLNRLVRKRRDATTGTVLAEWAYDATGQKGLLASSVAYSPLGTVQVSNVNYDARNRLTQQQWSIPTQGTFRFDYGYNEANQQTTLRYPGGNAGQQGELVTKGYYAQTGQFNTASSDDGTQFVAYTSYNPLGQVIEQRNDSGTNGVTRRVTYDSATLRTNRIYAGSGSGASTNLQDLSFTFDNNGNIKSLADAINSGQKQCFGYDSLNRLTSAFTGDAGCSSFVNSGVGAYNHSYSYNAIGNITSNAGNAYTYGSLKPHAVTAAFGNTYGYDANGNQTSRTIGGVTYALTFDYDNRITEVKQSATTLGTFVYDADGNRVLGTVGSVTTAYIAGLYEWQAGATTKYYEGGGMRRSGYGTNNGISYALGDQLGSTSVIVGQSGATQATNYYFPFGGNRGGGAFSDLTTKRFTGQYHEAGLPGGEGLSYYNARWYDAQLGRFVSPDALVPNPSIPQQFNRYSYTHNNPTNFTDPSGNECDDGPQTWAACFGSAPSGSFSRNVWTAVDRANGSPKYARTLINLTRGMNSYARHARYTAPGRGAMPNKWVAIDSPLKRAMYASSPSTGQKLLVDWWFNQGPNVRVFGPEADITQNVRNSSRMNDVRKQFLSSQSWDKNSNPSATFGPLSHFTEPVGGYLVDDPSSWDLAIIGSFDVKFTPYTDSDGNKKVLVVAHNATTWQSGTRLTSPGIFAFASDALGPFMDYTNNQPPDYPNNGSIQTQYFWWIEQDYR